MFRDHQLLRFRCRFDKAHLLLRNLGRWRSALLHCLLPSKPDPLWRHHVKYSASFLAATCACKSSRKNSSCRRPRSCPSLIRPLCTNASTIGTSQTMRRIFVACQNPRLSAVSPALNHAASSSSEAIHESCNASIYSAVDVPYQLLCSHTQSVCAECMCVVLTQHSTTQHNTSKPLRTCACALCACVNVSKSVWCVVSCHVVINGPREQQSANSAIRRNSYDSPDPTLRHSRVSKFTRDSLSCVSLFVF